MEAPQLPPSSIAPPCRASSPLLSPSSPQEPSYIMTTMTPQRIGMDRLHELQCHASERLVGGASEDRLSDAIACWGSILRQLLPHIIGGAAAAMKDDGASTSKSTTPAASTTNTMAMWVAPVSPSPHNPVNDDAAAAAAATTTTTTIFSLFPYVLVYTAVASASASTESESAAQRCCLVPGSSDARRVGAGVAYNLALAYHLQALQRGHGRGHQQRQRQRQQQQQLSSVNSTTTTPSTAADNYYASLRTALGAYKAARDLLVSAVTTSSARQQDESASHWRQRLTEDDRLLLLAITNNEGHIYELLHERNRVVEALEGLRMGLEGVANPAGICGHFTITDALFGDRSVVHNMHSAAA